MLLAGSPIAAKELRSSVRVVIGFLVNSLIKVLLAKLLSLVRWPALGWVWVVPYSFHLRMMELTMFLGTFNTLEIPFPRSIPPHNSISEFCEQFLGPYGRVSALTCTVNSGTSYRKVCFFRNHIQSFELATDRLQSSCGDISRMIKRNGTHLSSIWSVIAKVLNIFIDTRHFNF